MKKTKRIAAAVVGIVLASSMCVGMVACDNDEVEFTYAEYIDIYDTDVSSVELNLQIGHNSNVTSTSYLKLGDAITMPDGVTYQEGDMKATWSSLATALGVKGFNDIYQAQSTSANLDNALQAASTEDYAWSNTDIITSDLSEVTEAASNGTSFLNLGKYLNSMPNFKAYLDANPVVEYSIVSNVSSDNEKTIYVSPYFDGNDDIERYVIARQDWVDIILGDTTLSNDGATWKAASASSGSTAVESYMGQTGYVAVDVTDTSDNSKTKTIYKNYANVLTEIADTSSDLYAAYYAIAGAVYNGTSGNIVDIQNKALEANNEATGKALATLLRAYVDACYTTTSTGSTSYYSDAADLFNGADAAWDVDDLVALLRCVITNSANLCSSSSGTATGIFTRTSLNDRTPDMIRLAGQLYGVRGVDSRYEYTYLDADGELQSALNDAELWEALDNMHDLYSEGLVYNGNYSSETNADGDKTTLKGGNATEGFMMYDYVQTQTLYGFYNEQEGLSDPTTYKLGENYNFTPILNPVSKWSVNGTDDVTMRFTESWRSTKTSGIAINASVESDPAKLAACLKFVDYLFSNDGKILMTYGPMASEAGDGNTSSGGYWYNTPATGVTLSDVAELEEESGQYTIKDEYKAQYFVYNNTVYTGTYYKGYRAPTLTTATVNAFLGISTVGKAIVNNTNITKAALSFTNFARMIIGSTLPVAVKDQCFEYQLTSEMGKAGADYVGDALVNGAIKGMTVGLDSATYGKNAFWYMVVPTGLPFLTAESTSMSTDAQLTLQYLTGTGATSDLVKSKNFYSIFQYVVIYGLNGGTYTSNAQNWTVGSSAEDMVSKIGSQGATSRETYAQDAWNRLVGWYNIKL